MSISIISAPDPFLIGDDIFPGWNNPNGLTPRSQIINPAQKTLVLISAGQSLRANATTNLYTPINSSAVDNFNVYDGASYPISGPLLGPFYFDGVHPPGGLGPGNPMAYVADQFVASGKFDRVILVPLAVNGTGIAIWATGQLATKVPVAMKRLASRGIVPGMTGVTFALEFGQGEQDGVMGTSQAAWVAGWNLFKVNCDAAGFNGRYFVPLETWQAGATSSTIRAAQASVVDGIRVFQSGDIDTLNATFRQSDNTHMLNAPPTGALIYNAMHASGSPF